MKYICDITGKEKIIDYHDILGGFKCEFCGKIIDSEESGGSVSIWCKDDSHEISYIISDKPIEEREREILGDINNLYEGLMENINSNPSLIESIIKFKVFEKKKLSKEMLIRYILEDMNTINQNILSERIEELIRLQYIFRNEKGFISRKE
jgi:hypothetical protein